MPLIEGLPLDRGVLVVDCCLSASAKNPFSTGFIPLSALFPQAFLSRAVFFLAVAVCNADYL
jgi:hypothetical protein